MTEPLASQFDPRVIEAPLYAWWLFGVDYVPAASLVIGLLIAWRHKENIARLIAGTEPRLGAKKAS